MGLGTLLVAMLIVFVLLLLVSEYFVRRLNIKRTKIGAFTKGRRKGFMAIEVLLFVLFTISIFTTWDSYPYSNRLSIFMFFTSIYLFRGIEEWIYRRANKGYYHEWLASLAFLVLFLFSGYMFLNN